MNYPRLLHRQQFSAITFARLQHRSESTRPSTDFFSFFATLQNPLITWSDYSIYTGHGGLAYIYLKLGLAENDSHAVILSSFNLGFCSARL
jgi:hypothetical protein